MPHNAPAVKMAATRAYGAQVVLYDPLTEKREDVAARLMQGQSWVLVPPYNHEEVIAGQGTIGVEIYQDLPEVELVLVPVGGGGLISGVATALQNLKPGVRVIGVEPELADDARQSLRSGRIVEYTAAQTGRTIADGTRTLSVGDLTLAHMQHYVDDIITVSEASIRRAVRDLLLKHKLLIEPSGALAYAAWHSQRDALPAAKHVALVLSGGNIEPALLADILQSG
jgi:threonine dehydratase